MLNNYTRTEESVARLMVEVVLSGVVRLADIMMVRLWIP